MRYDLSFFLCCCKSFLGSDPEGEDYYALLGLSKDASADEIKRAYKRQSLQMHPDKLAQKGQTVTEQDQARFTRMKEAYEVLSDPHKRETYDAIGERGMKWLEEPFSIDPQELAHNFATSTVLDRSKIFMIFVAIAVAVLILPVLVCLHVDGAFGHKAKWSLTLIPLWIWDAVILFYHVRVIMMGPIPRPDHISEQDWIDPLPMKKRIFSLARFLLIALFEVLVALKLDHIIPHSFPWWAIFFPLYAWEASTLYKKWPLARMRIVTVEDLEAALGKPFSQFTPAEKELIGKRYSVVPSVNSPDFEVAQKLKIRARHDIIKALFRIAFVVVLLFQLDADADWNWWLIFMPFWIMTGLICYANYQSFAEVQRAAAEKDPTTFGHAAQQQKQQDPKEDVEMGKTSYGATGQDGGASRPTQPQTGTTPATGTATAAQNNPNPPPTLTEEEREELKAQVMASSSRLCSKCCSQCFLLMIVALFVAKLQGAGFSSLWIISPFLLVAGMILCCVGCAIFGITEVPTDGVEFDTGDFSYSQADTAGNTHVPPPPQQYHQSSQPQPAAGSTNYVPPPVPSEAAPPPSLRTSPVPNPDPPATNSGSAAIAMPAAPAATTTTKTNTTQPSGTSTGPIDLLDSEPPSSAKGKSGEFDDLD